MEEQGREILRKLVDTHLTSGEAVLEVGAGGGELLMEFAEKYGGEMWGIDPHIPRRDHALVTFADIPAEEVETIGRSFDLVFSLYSLHHFRNFRLFLAQLGGVLRPEGRFVFVDWRRGVETGIPETYFSLRQVVEMVEGNGYPIVEHGETPEHLYVVGRAALRG